MALAAPSIRSSSPELRTRYVAGFCMALAVAGGGFDHRARAIAAVVAMAGAFALTRPATVRLTRWLPAGLLGIPLLISAGVNGWPSGWQAEAALIAIAGSVAVVARRLSASQALEICASVGATLATLGIAGIILRVEPLAIDASPWRIGANIGYQNAAGTVLGVSFVAALALTAVRSDRVTRVMATLCGIGLIGTMSRGALLASVVAVTALYASRTRFDTRPLGWTFAGAAALAPAALEAPFGAVVTVAGVGAALAMSARTADRPRTRTVAAAVALALVIAGGAATALGTRDGATSNQRLAVWTATLAAMDHDLLTGTGPGTFNLMRVRDGQIVTTKHAHNEYIEVLSEQGVVGLLGMVTAFALIVVRLIRARPGVARAAALAIAVLVAIHASLDFILQIPAVLALVAVPLAAALGPDNATEER